MTVEQTLILLILAGAGVLFVAGKPRYDVVALLALLACAILGLVPASDVFNGFGHPAVITVASVLVISRALRNAGIISAVLYLGADLLLRPAWGNTGVWTAFLMMYVFRAAALGAYVPGLFRDLSRRLQPVS